MNVMRGDTIVGYIYQADILCPDCTLNAYRETARAMGHVIDSVAPPTRLYPNVEAILEDYAVWRAITRGDEYTFDSDDFPKVLFADISDGEYCGTCARNLIDVAAGV